MSSHCRHEEFLDGTPDRGDLEEASDSAITVQEGANIMQATFSLVCLIYYIFNN